MLSTQIPEEFSDIRPYATDELPQVFDELLADEQFMAVATRLVPDLKAKVRAAVPALQASTDATLTVQKTLIYPLVRHVIDATTSGIDLSVPEGFDHSKPHTFITNHRDIVLDPALLSYLLVENGFTSTVEIAIGDNLLVYPWIKRLVRINKSFIVQRSLSMREMLRASQVMSRYMHFVATVKRDNIWIAQREGRAKDSNDRTQDSILKMMAMGGEGSITERLKELNITPMALSYEYDPCDYLKAREFQQKRDIEGFRKSQADDLLNMQTGIMGRKGRIHFQATEPINAWLDTIDPATPKAELFHLIAQHIDRQIFSAYRLYPGNYVAADELSGTPAHADRYSEAERQAFCDYVAQRVAMVDLHKPDTAYLRQRILTMYANPVINHEQP